MVTKSKRTGEKKGRVKVGKLKLNKETVKDLSALERERVKGGAALGIQPKLDLKPRPGIGPTIDNPVSGCLGCNVHFIT